MSSYVWGEPDGRNPIKYSDQPAGFVEPASFVPSHWQYEEDGKGSAADPNIMYSDTGGARIEVRDEELTEDDYGELEIVLKYKGKSGSSIRSKSLKLTSRLAKRLRKSVVPKSEHPAEDLSDGLHGVYSSRDSRQICVLDETSGCACKDFSPSIFRNLLAQTLNSVGLTTTQLLDGLFDQYLDQDCHNFAVSDHPTEENVGASSSRQDSGAFGKKRLLSNASEENVQIQPSKKNPRLQADSADGQEFGDAEGDGERHTCPYFKMFPELHLECGTKDLAQRPKIKSHIIKDHLKKNNQATPPEIKSQKCDPWDRWCKWIVQDGDKADRPVPNSTPDFYPILNYIVKAASDIPSDGLTCFSSIMLRLFKSVQASPGDWSSFVNGLEELEQSLNNPTLSVAGSTCSARRIVPSQKEDEMLASGSEDVFKREETIAPPMDTQPLHHEDTPIQQYASAAPPNPTESLSTSTYNNMQHAQPPTFTNITQEISPLTEDYAHAHSNNHLPPNMYPHPSEFDLSHWIDYNIMADPTFQHERPRLYSYESENLMEKPVETALDHFSIPPGVGTSSRGLVRAAHSPRVRKRKNGTVRQESVEGAQLNDSAPPSQIHTLSVLSEGREEKFEFSGRFSVSQFQYWLRDTFGFSFNRDDGRKLWCMDVKEDIQVHAPDGIKAHLKTWSTKASFTSVPSFRIGTSAARTLGSERWAKITPDFVEEIYANELSADDSPLVYRVRPDSQSNRQA